MDLDPFLYTASIASGSNGNCYYIGNDQEAILVDIGISCRELERRMMRMGLEMQRVKALFISHEHTDHIKGLAVVANKFQLPVFLTKRTMEACRLAIPSRLLYELKPGYGVQVGDLEVVPFQKFHDAADPQSFIVRQSNRTVGVFTDIGQVCDPLRHYFSQCDIAFLETNYDEELLDQGRYPYFLKNRIRGGLGHLSNGQAFKLFQERRSDKLHLLYLCHLSKDNNDPKLVEDLFKQDAGQTHIVLAGRDAETAVYKLKLTKASVLNYEKNSLYYYDGVITTYQSCTIRWSVQSV